MSWWKCGFLFIGFFFSIAIAKNSAAQNVPVQASSSLQSWLSQQNATGNWGGIRSTLKNQGVTISSNYTTDLATNPSGGEKRGSTYAGFWSAGLALDFEKLADIKGLSLNISGYWLSGRSLSEKYIGNLYGVQEISAPGTYYFGQLNLSQSLFNGALTIEAGRLFAADVFATNPLWGYYVNGGININLNSIPVNIFFPEFQVAAWGARVAYQPAKEWHFIAGIYNADPSVAGTNKHGLDFSLDTSKGALAIGQVTYQHHQGREATGLPGRISLGGYYESNKFTNLNDPSGQSWGNYGGYFIIDQMVYRGNWPEYKGPSHLRAGASHAERAKHPYQPQSAAALDRPYGLTAWFGLYAAPKESINKQMLQLAGGLVYQGLIPNRDLDVTALGVISGKFSNRLTGQGAETFVELNHRFQVSPWFYVTPDVQYIINPNGASKIHNALVLALEVSVSF